MSNDQLKREQFIKGESLPFGEFQNGRRKSKNCFRYWISCFWRYISKSGPKINNITTSIGDLKTEEINNWKYSKLILDYDLISMRRTKILLRKASQRNQTQFNNPFITKDKTQKSKTLKQNDLICSHSGRVSIDSVELKKELRVEDNKNLSNFIQNFKNDIDPIDSLYEPSQLVPAIDVIDFVKPLFVKDSKVERTLPEQQSYSKSPKAKLPSTPTDEKPTSSYVNTPIRVSSSFFSMNNTVKQLKQEEFHTKDFGENIPLEGITTNKKNENFSSDYSSSIDSCNIVNMSAKERNKRFIKSTRSDGSFSNADADNKNHRNEIMISDFESLSLSDEENNVRFYRKQKSRRSTNEKLSPLQSKKRTLKKNTNNSKKIQ